MPTLTFPNGSNVVVTAPAAKPAAAPTIPTAPPAPTAARKMFIEAVIPCLNYSDFLAETLPRNLPLFDNVVVVTSLEDAATIELCRKLSVECRPTDEWFLDGDKQNLGRAVNYGIGFCKQSGWLSRLDADIYLPPLAREWIEIAEPDPECIFGIDRVNCIGWNAWRGYIDKPQPELQHNWHCLITPPPFPLGGRIAIRPRGGFIPIGFFQLWHSRTNRRYPYNFGTAEHTDVQHSMQWPSHYRRLLPEVIAVHLESEPAILGANWDARTTKLFGPPSGTPACPPPKPYVKPS